MEHNTPNKYDDFFQNEPAPDIEKEANLEKLLATKRSIQDVEAEYKFKSTKLRIDSSNHKISKTDQSKNRLKANTKENNTFSTDNSFANKKKQSPFVMDSLFEKTQVEQAEESKKESQKPILPKPPLQKGFGDHSKGDIFLTDKLITKSTSPNNNQQETLSSTATLEAEVSANTYGAGTNPEQEIATHVTDLLYERKEIPTDGKNLIPRSQEVHDILSYVPNWMIRWGNTVILLILAGIIVMSYYIKYPDVIKGVVSINSAYPPVPLVSKTSGSLTLLKEDKETVYPEEVIGIIKSTADYKDVLHLKEELVSFKDKLEKGGNFSSYQLPTGLQLGGLQESYNHLFIKLKEQKLQHKSGRNDNTRKQSISKQLRELETIKKAKEKSLSIKYQEYLKAKNILENRYQVLYKKGSISTEQINAKESEVRNLLDIYQNDRMSFNEIKNRIIDLNSSQIEIDFNREDKNILSQSALITAYQSLKNNIKNWEETYLLTSPIAGKINLVQYTKNNVYLQQAQTIANIIPDLNISDTSTVMIGELVIPTIGAGKAAIGQEVIVALNDYPKKQFGTIEARVKSISDISIEMPNNNGRTGYKVMISFPKGLTNTMNKEIQFKHNMHGNAEIITEDVRLLQRFFHELRDLFDAT